MTDEALDRLLQGWAARHALSSERAEAIRVSVLASQQITVEGLPAGWWRGFGATLTTTLRQATYLAPAIWHPVVAPQARSVST
jgi:hypothetical protein